MRLIDADALADALFEKRKNYPQWVADTIGNMPDAIIRCKDCRHCTFSDGEQLADCMIKQGWFPVKPDWFCADGKRKEGRDREKVIKGGKKYE